MVSTMPAMPGSVSVAPQQHEAGEDEGDMDQQRDIGEDAEDAIGHQHIDADESRADIGRALAGVDRILAEARPDGALLDDGELGRKRAGAQQDGEIIGRIRR